ncbi:MAG: Holliday junction branch migration protein RuvA [Thermoanaerobaculia bacterium]|nr:MAG: Holliday junction branch migration protein RuvA [Thermoanaerobaculia bacterium]MBZ0103974.1 Holliday junction branch migration protein RuvA [Thermoanaerobaculia bacterium]
MIGALRGRLATATPERVIVDVGGVGYAVHVSLATFSELDRAGLGAEVALHVHTHVREDQIALYGFATSREMELFERLIAVSGIGPRLAQVVLSGMAVEDLVAALAAGDLARLTRIPGVGRKTAERMVVELRDRVHELGGGGAGPAGTATASDDDLVAALEGLGYKPAQAERAVAEARREAPGAAFHELLPLALRRLSRA